MIPPERVVAAYLDACRFELQAMKPGNVHVFADGHRMTVADFEASAQASAPSLTEPGLSVGARIHQAVRRTRDTVGTNTNLGILLLCAPIAEAALNVTGDRELRGQLGLVLARLDLADAEEAFAAIRLAAPAGLGESARHDVRQPAQTSLLAAMTEAQARDRIAAQYATGFRDIFELGLPRLDAGLRRWSDLRWAASSAYLGFLAAFTDSHVVRKHGPQCAETVRRAAGALDVELLASAAPTEMIPALLALDTSLKAQGINPGTSADLTVASLFVHLLGHAAGD